MQVHGFKRKDARGLLKLLRERSNRTQENPQVSLPQVGRRLATGYIAKATTGIPAFDSSTDTAGSNTVEVYKSVSGVLTSTGLTLQVENLYGEVASGSLVSINLDNYGTWWVDEPRTPICQFTLNADFDTTDATVAATVTKCSHKAYETTTITLNNHPASTNYIFEGDSGDTGSAWYDGNNGEWHILQMEC